MISQTAKLATNLNIDNGSNDLGHLSGTVGNSSATEGSGCAWMLINYSMVDEIRKRETTLDGWMFIIGSSRKSGGKIECVWCPCCPLKKVKWIRPFHPPSLILLHGKRAAPRHSYCYCVRWQTDTVADNIHNRVSFGVPSPPTPTHSLPPSPHLIHDHCIIQYCWFKLT